MNETLSATISIVAQAKAFFKGAIDSMYASLTSRGGE